MQHLKKQASQTNSQTAFVLIYLRTTPRFCSGKMDEKWLSWELHVCSHVICIWRHSCSKVQSMSGGNRYVYKQPPLFTTDWPLQQSKLWLTFNVRGKAGVNSAARFYRTQAERQRQTRGQSGETAPDNKNTLVTAVNKLQLIKKMHQLAGRKSAILLFYLSVSLCLNIFLTFNVRHACYVVLSVYGKNLV